MSKKNSRLHDLRNRFARKRSKGLIPSRQDSLYRAGTPQDVTSPRAKSQRNGKVTADRWNQ
jgi:hypothetical protein